MADPIPAVRFGIGAAAVEPREVVAPGIGAALPGSRSGRSPGEPFPGVRGQHFPRTSAAATCLTELDVLKSDSSAGPAFSADLRDLSDQIGHPIWPDSSAGPAFSADLRSRRQADLKRGPDMTRF
eukprot:g20823.t1